ncbi:MULTISPECIES: hypothetical protein [Blautia]|uniref:hypothetical protein n=1 Tax=Blautia TaxID=572511 RepID=UPI000BA3432E|nr:MULTISPECIES: hypothetical protein [Blautia]
MWYGGMTPELETLYDQYYEMFQGDPDEYIELEYGQQDYEDYVRDIKKAIEQHKELPEVVK